MKVIQDSQTSLARYFLFLSCWTLITLRRLLKAQHVKKTNKQTKTQHIQNALERRRRKAWVTAMFGLPCFLSQIVLVSTTIFPLITEQFSPVSAELSVPGFPLLDGSLLFVSYSYFNFRDASVPSDLTAPSVLGRTALNLPLRLQGCCFCLRPHCSSSCCPRRNYSYSTQFVVAVRMQRQLLHFSAPCKELLDSSVEEIIPRKSWFQHSFASTVGWIHCGKHHRQESCTYGRPALLCADLPFGPLR